jgi:hypothetical protein
LLFQDPDLHSAKVVCFPVKLQETSVGPARVAAIRGDKSDSLIFDGI